MTIQFTKMHGLGNDFVVINALKTPLSLSSTSISKLANRQTGLGFDQLLVIEASNKADFFCRIFNADGSEAEQCGNGLRCIARYLVEEKLTQQKSFAIETKAGIFPVDIKDFAHITIMMGVPQIEEKLISLREENLSLLSMGNPHAILRVSVIEDETLAQKAADIAKHPRFAQGINMGFMQVIDAHHIRLRTIERGAGETCACGSNACAAVVAGIANGWLQSPVTVTYRYGDLQVAWDGESVRMCGPAARVFDGEIN